MWRCTTGTHALQIDLRVSDAAGAKENLGARRGAGEPPCEHLDLLCQERVVEHGNVEPVAPGIDGGALLALRRLGSSTRLRVGAVRLPLALARHVVAPFAGGRMSSNSASSATLLA